MKKSSNTWQIALACAVLISAAASAVLFNPATKTQNDQATTQAAETQTKQDGNSFAITNVRVFDGEKIIEKTSVLVENGKIAAIGQSLTLDKQTPRYDGTGKTLIPGLIDAHTHTFREAQKDALRFGVTTELDMFTDWHLLADAKKQRESEARTEQADLWSAGTLATVPGGHGTEYGMKIPTLSSAAEAAGFVQERVQEGSDYIKIVFDDGSAYGPSTKIKTLAPEVTRALIASAHDQHKKALIHIASLQQSKLMVEQGADGLVHMFIDQVADADFITHAKKQGLFMVPTLSVTASLAGADEGKNLASDPQLKDYLSPQQSNALKTSFPAQWQNPKVLERALLSVKLLHDAGVPLLAGTDAGNPSTSHGASMHGELALLVRAGLTPSQALVAATALPAKTFGLTDRGRIAVGLRADMILLNDDPTKDILASRKINTIWKNGFRFTRAKVSAVTMPASPRPSGSLVSDFEQEQINSAYGKGWSITTDQQMGGASVAAMRRVAEGAQQSHGALEITGEIKTGFAFPWAGVFFTPGEKPMQAVDYSQQKEIIFWVKGDGKDKRQFSVMAFSSTATAGAPPSQTFKVGAEWQQIRLPLQKFEGLDVAHVVGFSFSASAPQGQFSFMIDNVEIQ
ncbi:MAG: CIA30 family protein [Burkholderiaceae bacterium]|nr:CIA30 family protein [Burkholderiaceae bacterium]